MKKKKTFKAVALALVATLLFGTGIAFAANFLNWTGSDTMTKTGIFIDQITNKVIKVEEQKADLEKEKAELEKEVEELKKELEDKGDEGWTEKDDIIVDLNNQIIEKQNEIEHLKRELTRANDAANVIQNKLDDAYKKLEEKGINIWY